MPSLKEKFGSVIDDADAFDATESAAKAGKAGFDALSEDLDRFLGDFRSEQVATGRFQTGFRFEDEDRIVTDAMEDLQQELARNAIATAGLDQDNLRTRGELISGALDRETADKNFGRRKRSGLFGLIGAGVGLAIPVVGPLLGGVLGEAVGGLF